MKKNLRDLTGAPMRRICHIHNVVRHGRKTNARQLGRQLEVSVRTIKRDIEDMQVQFGAPIAWDEQRQSYRYTAPFDDLPFARLNGRDALIYAAAGYVFAGCGGALGRALAGLLRKLAPMLAGVMSVSFDSVAQAVTARLGSRVDELRYFLPLLEACLDRRCVRLGYRKPQEDQVELRAIQPLHLAERAQHWVLFAFDENRGAIRSFRLSRVRSVQRTRRQFPARAFDPAALLRGSLGRFTGDTEIEVQIALDGIAERYARDTPWHELQVLTPSCDGRRAVLTLRLNSLIEITNVVLGWGEHVEVLSPPELRAEVRRHVATTLARYDGTAGQAA